MYHKLMLIWITKHFAFCCWPCEHAIFCYLFQRYSTHLQWVDGTVVYIYQVIAGHFSPSLGICSKVDFTQQRKNKRRKDFSFPLKLHRCNTNETIGFICERHLKSEKRIQITSPEIAENETFPTDLYLTCPSGHVTHKFLSCDLQNFCWARHLSSTTICESPLSHVPPNFVCSSETEQVPYPLVCDHRPDCRDYSDENFCVFPACSATSFECGNKQVTMILSLLMR